MNYHMAQPSHWNLRRHDGRKLAGTVFEDALQIPDGLGCYTFPRHAWTGGNVPPKVFPAVVQTTAFKTLRRLMFRELLAICGGLDLWVCAGTSSLERARIFWNQATLDAWRTLNSAGIYCGAET